MAGPIGRIGRVVAALALAWWGWSFQSGAGWAIAALGSVVFLAGALNLCLFAPFMRLPFRGADLSQHRS